MRKIISIFILVFCVTFLQAQTSNELTQREQKQGWKLLFNGENLDGWTSVGKTQPPAVGWQVNDGILTARPQNGKRGGDIVTLDQYSDFDLKVDFKLSEGGNSGIKYYFTRYEKGGWLGLEYQLLDDDVHPDGKLGRNGNRKTATLYDVLPVSAKKVMKPAGEWNTARIVAKGTKVTHYLNGKKVLTFDRKSDVYKNALILSKYNNAVPAFGDVKEGYILLQDHGDEVSFRNVKIRTLK
mgnify:CR=1 FL=1